MICERIDLGDDAEIAVVHAEVLVACRELDTLASGKLTRHFPVSIHTSEPPRVVGDALAVLAFNGDGVVSGICRNHCRDTIALNSIGFAAGRVLQHVTRLVSCCPLSIGAGHIRAVDEGTKLLVVFGQRAGGLKFDADGLIDKLTTPIIGRDNNGVVGPGCIVLRNGLDAILCLRNLGDSTLFPQQPDAFDWSLPSQGVEPL